MSSTTQAKADFDEIARLADPGASGTDRYDAMLLSLIPANAIRVLDVGCGLGRLTLGIAVGNREVVGVDLSPVMIEKARLTAHCDRVSFLEGDFIDMDLGAEAFDCVVSAAALHHMPQDLAVSRMISLIRPGGRLVIQDLRRDSSLLNSVRAYSALMQTALTRLVRTGRPRPPKQVRDAWARHGARERYLSLREVHALADRHFRGARVLNHWLWRFTIVWDKPPAAAPGGGRGRAAGAAAA